MNLTEPKKQLNVKFWTEPQDNGLSVMDSLFSRFDATYPSRWRAAFTSEQAVANWRDVWAGVFADEGITPVEIQRGLKACLKTYDWPPSLTEFLKVCRPMPPWM